MLSELGPAETGAMRSKRSGRSCIINKQMNWKQNNKLSFTLIIVVAITLFASPIFTQAQVTGVPEIISYQGRLTNPTGVLESGTFCFQFSIYNDADISAPNTKLWPAGDPGAVTQVITDGVFNVNIGDTVNGYPDALTNNDFQANDTIFLNVVVAERVGATCAGGDEIFENFFPRQQITSSGFAINAGSVLGKIPGTGVDNILLLDGSGNIALAGSMDTGSTIQAGSSDITLTLASGMIDADAITLFGGAPDVGIVQSASGLETESDGLSLLQGCGDNQILKWDETDDDWNCEDDATGGAGSAWDAIGDPPGAGIVLMGQTDQNLNWDMSSDVALNALEITMIHDVADTTTQKILVVTNLDDSAVAGTLETILSVENRDINEIVTNGLLIENTAAGTITNAIRILETAGEITDGIVISSTLGNILNSLTIDITGAGAITANGGITFDQASDTIGSFTANGTILMNTNILQDIGNTGTDFIATTGALTLAGDLTLTNNVL